jgi:hypothetical protein
VKYTYGRSVWNKVHPVTGPAFRWSGITRIVIHYTGADNLIDGDRGEDWGGLPRFIDGINTYYVRSRGYSIGYNAAVDQRGHTWELRGDTFRCAANKGWNEVSFAILVLVDGNDTATSAAVEGVRDLVRQVRERAAGALIVGHGEIGSTSCPGIGLRSQIANGVFEPSEVDVRYEVWGPARIVDTRSGAGGKSGAFKPGETFRFVRNPLIPAGAKVLDAHVTVIDPPAGGFVTVWNGTVSRPVVSQLNHGVGGVINNSTRIPLAADGSFRLYTHGGGNVTVDVVGYFM